MITHNLSKQPKWVQEYIKNLEFRISELENIKQLHAILTEHGREWFTINNNGENVFTLWRFFRDVPYAVCSLSDKDVFFVGRATKDKIPF